MQCATRQQTPPTTSPFALINLHLVSVKKYLKETDVLKPPLVVVEAEEGEAVEVTALPEVVVVTMVRSKGNAPRIAFFSVRLVNLHLSRWERCAKEMQDSKI